MRVWRYFKNFDTDTQKSVRAEQAHDDYVERKQRHSRALRLYEKELEAVGATEKEIEKIRNMFEKEDRFPNYPADEFLKNWRPQKP